LSANIQPKCSKKVEIQQKFNHIAPVVDVDSVLNANHALTEIHVMQFSTKEGKKLPHTAINRSAL
jgi:hypothetical protein